MDENKAFIANLIALKGFYIALSTDRATVGKKLLQVSLSAGCSCYL